MYAYIHWNVSPVIVHFGPLTVRWYGVFFATLFAIGYLIVRWQFRLEHKDERELDTLLVYLVIGTIVGARLGHCFFYEPGYFLRHPVEILEVWQGGLASHGGALGVLVAIWLFSRRRPALRFLWLLDRIVVPTALGGSLIRLGNFFNSEILGEPTLLPWGIVFEQATEPKVPRHPAQLYESISYGLVFVGLMLVYRRLKTRTPPGLLLGLFFVSVFTFRFLIEFVKERQAAYEANLPLSVGQLLSLPFIVAGLVLVWRAARDGKSPVAGTAPTPPPGRPTHRAK